MLAAEPERFRWSNLLAARDEYLAASVPADPDRVSHPLPARSVGEANLFINLHRCVCGADDFRHNVEELPDNDPVRLMLRYSGVCPNCGRDRVFVFTVPRTPTGNDQLPAPMGFGFSVPDDGPAALIDAGQFAVAGEGYEEVVANLAGTAPDAWTEDTWEEMLDALATSVAFCDELLALVPDGTHAVPDEEFRTPIGRAIQRRCPELFTRDRLVRERAHRQQRLDEFVATVPEPDDWR